MRSSLILTLTSFSASIAAAASIQCSATNQTTACLCAPNQAKTTYPNKCQISEVFGYLADGNFTAFLSKVSPTVNWTIMGTHPLAGTYTNRTIFAIDALQRLSNTLQSTAGTTPLTLTQIIGGGDEEWSVQELHGLGTCKNGLKYDNRFAWITRWSTEGIILQVRAYLDSALVHRAITENESKEYLYSDQRDVLQAGPSGIGCTSN
ncbi:hypothetical protein BT63DRAFT_459017 [Microthyrium microscopicum]|uniref:SnoaL-like domain-containing protein n=1 Tax=Microthyrium microscopicum TaxID=703497 RepID=A0A6A6U024_9PEZI|nr:hypothetical protein BT63DRAFT_459017 [Microthyrium microscopicum]